MGIRISGSALSYSSRASSDWVGSGILNKPMGDFFTGTFHNIRIGSSWVSWFEAFSNGSVRITVNKAIISEME